MPVLQVSSTQSVWSAWDSLWQQVKVSAEGVPVVLPILHLAQSTLALVARFVHCLNSAEHSLEETDKFSQATYHCWLTLYSLHRRYRESPEQWHIC